MIHTATLSESESIAKALWTTWHQLKSLQLGAVPREYPSCEVLAERIRGELYRWFVYQTDDSQQMGFFSISHLGGEKNYQKLRFPEQSIRVENFACLLSGEVLLQQFHLLVLHFKSESILICIPSPLREAYWAALKAGFRILGESPLIISTFVWLYLDRAQRFDEIQCKLRRAKIINAIPEASSRSRKQKLKGQS